jgi:hypothetical protein
MKSHKIIHVYSVSNFSFYIKFLHFVKRKSSHYIIMKFILEIPFAFNLTQKQRKKVAIIATFRFSFLDSYTLYRLNYTNTTGTTLNLFSLFFTIRIND